MLFLATPDPLGEFVVNLLYALGCLIGTTHFTTSPDPPQPKFAAEVGVMSGVSYEQPIGGKFSLVGKAGVTMLDQGNPWAYSGFQPAAELGLRWYFSGVSPSNANNEGSYLALRSFISYQKMAFWAARPDLYHHVAAFEYSCVGAHVESQSTLGIENTNRHRRAWLSPHRSPRSLLRPT